MTGDLRRRALSELVGTTLLTATVVGSGIAAARLSPDDVGLQLLENSLATGAVLVALIVALGPVSASFNPVVTVVDTIRRRSSPGAAGTLIASQVIGALAGCVLANLMFDLPAITVAQHHRFTGSTFLAEVVATAGLVLVIFSAAQRQRIESTALVVGAYITAAYWFTSSTSFANPAVTIGRTLSDTFAGIAPASVPAFVVAQVVGAAVGLALVTLLHPPTTREAIP